VTSQRVTSFDQMKSTDAVAMVTVTDGRRTRPETYNNRKEKRTRVENCSTGVTTLCSEDMMIGCWGWSSLIISQTKLPVLI